MKIIVGDRQTGKTLSLLRRLRYDPYAVYIGMNESRVESAKDLAKEYGYDIPDHQFYTLEQYSRRRISHLNTVYIDDADDLLRKAINHNGTIKAITITNEG